MHSPNTHMMLRITGPVDDERQTYNALLNACNRAGAHVVGTLRHEFFPRGFSAMVMISESHASIHTWPEDGYALVDYFTCAASPNCEAFEASLVEAGYKVVHQETVIR